MSILCGTDFSPRATFALTAAARLAARMNVPLHLLHSIELSRPDQPNDALSDLVAWARTHLEQQAERLRSLGAQVSVHIESGSPDDALQAKASEVSAKLIVVAALGRRRPGKWQLGSHADRLAQRSHVPVLVVRESEPFSAWADGTKPLRILLGADLSLSSKAAWHWIDQLRTFGPCEVIAIHLYWPPAQLSRFGLVGVRDYLAPDPEVSAVLQHELRQHLGTASDPNALQIRVEPHMGRLGDRLAVLAQDEHADLVVVGSHERSLAGRLWEGSVSRAVLHGAQTAVACIPVAPDAAMKEAPRLHNIVVATDFSTVGNAAIPLAYAVAPRGATVHLVHVVKDRVHNPLEPHDVVESAARTGAVPEHDAARDKLVALIPPGTIGSDKSTHLHILESNQVADAICQGAERFSADLICLGTHGRGGVAKTVLGSVAQAVMTHTQRPVLFAREPRE